MLNRAFGKQDIKFISSESSSNTFRLSASLLESSKGQKILQRWHSPTEEVVVLKNFLCLSRHQNRSFADSSRRKVEKNIKWFKKESVREMYFRMIYLVILPFRRENSDALVTDRSQPFAFYAWPRARPSSFATPARWRRKPWKGLLKTLKKSFVYDNGGCKNINC